jgi:hypothetical protein
MTDTTATPTIDSLLADRARYESWLTQLAAKAAQVPAHVVARVQADYQGRLDAVLATLTARADELRAEASALATRVTALDVELAAKRDLRAEDELRALVGEHEDAVWTTRAAEHDAAIASVVEARDEAARERDRLQSMLGDATRPSRALAAVADMEMEVEPTVGANPEPTPAQVELAVPSDMPEVVEAPVATAPTAEVPAVAAPSPEPGDGFADLLPLPTFDAPPSPRSSRATSFDEIAFLDTVVGRSMVTPTTPAPEVIAPPAAAEPDPFEDAVLEPAPVAPSSAASAQSDAARSLKCQECGWMNVPTEWYCEKCGGELSAF